MSLRRGGRPAVLLLIDPRPKCVGLRFGEVEVESELPQLCFALLTPTVDLKATKLPSAGVTSRRFVEREQASIDESAHATIHEVQAELRARSPVNLKKLLLDFDVQHVAQVLIQ